MKIEFCGEFVGYIEGYELAGENYPDNLTEEQLRALIVSIISGGEADRKDYYVNKRIKGYTEDVLPGGRSLFSLFGVQEEATTGNSLEVTSGSTLAFEITEETTTEQALQLMALADDAELEITPINFIHNLIMWDGTVVDENGENPQKLAADENYIIVLEPSTPSMNYYRSYLAIRTTNSIPDVPPGLSEFAELFQMITGDPVDLLTGALNWEYTDISMYGDEDLPYTRYYNSKAAGEAGRLGYGWSDNYTYQVNMEPLYAEVVFPNNEKLYFEMGYDGAYKSKAGSAFTFEEGGSGYVLTHKQGTVYDFDTEGNIVSITELDGRVTNFSYSGGKLSSVSTETGTLNFAYDGDYVSAVTDSTGRSVTFSYSDDNLISAVNPDADDLQYTYDAYHRMLTIQNFNGEVYLSNQYDEKDRVTEQYVEGEGTFYFTYDGDSRVNTCTGENGYFQSIEYDALYRIIADTTNDGTEYFAYNEKNERVSYTNRLGHTWQYGHDENGNITSITYPNGAIEVYAYDGNNLAVSMSDRNGHTTRYDRDNSGNITAATDGNGNTTRYEYDTMGRCISATDPLGNVSTYTYDQAGNLLTATDPLGNITSYAYDSQGRMVSMTDALGYTTNYAYSIAGKLLKGTMPDGNELDYTVDGNNWSNTSESDWMATDRLYL